MINATAILRRNIYGSATISNRISASATLQTFAARVLSMKAITLNSGSINGSNTVFVFAQVPLQVFWQGQKLVKDASVNGYTLSGTTVTMTEAPMTGDHVEAYGVY